MSYLSDSYGGCRGGGGSGGGRGGLTKFPSSVRVRFLIFSTLLTLIFLFFIFFRLSSFVACLRSAARCSFTPWSGSSLVCRCRISCLAPYISPTSILSTTLAYLCPCFQRWLLVLGAFPRYLLAAAAVLSSIALSTGCYFQYFVQICVDSFPQNIQVFQVGVFLCMT